METSDERHPAERETYKWNLRHNFEETKAAMARVERADWLKNQERISRDWETLSGEEQTQSLEAARRWLSEIGDDVESNKIVAGSGYASRWIVHPDGSVRLGRFWSEGTSKGHIERATKEGFELE